MLSTDQLTTNGRYQGVGDILTPGFEPIDHRPPQESETRDLTRFIGGTRPSVSLILKWADQLLDALHKLHSQSPPAIHGRVSPVNLHLTTEDDVTLAVTPAAEPCVNYSPLEQIWGGLDPISQRVILDRYDADKEEALLRSPGPASDVYSAAATIYAISTGKVPPDALDRAIAEIEGKTDPLIPAAEINIAIPTEVSDVLMKAMSLHRGERYYSVVIFRQVLRTAAVRVKEREALAGETAAHEVEIAAVPAAIPAEVLAKVETPIEKEKAREIAIRILAKKETEATASPADAHESPEGDGDILEVPASPAPVIATRTEIPTFTPEPTVSADAKASGFGGRFLIAGAAAVLLLGAVAGGIYKFAGSTPDSLGSAPAVETHLSAQPAGSTVAPAPAPIETPGSAPAGYAPVEVQSPTEHEKTTRQLATAPVGEKPKKAAAPAPAKRQPTKKSLTVDDLINDH